MASEREILELLTLCAVYDLHGLDFVAGFSNAQLRADYNGIGPEWFPAKLRDAIDALHADLRPAAFVHDVRYSHNDGSREQFHAANDELRENGIRIANYLYGWYDPRRYIRRAQARAFATLCDHFGRAAYDEAYRKNHETRKEY